MQLHNNKFSLYGTFNKETKLETIEVYLHCRGYKLLPIGSISFSQTGIIDSSCIEASYKDEVSSYLYRQLKTEGIKNPIVVG